MIKGFKDFLLRGNVVDLAVAVVIGAALAALVGAFTEAFINPLIARFTGGGEVAGAAAIGKGQYLNYGLFITAIITFVITAAVVYLVIVVPMKKVQERRMRGQEAGPVGPTDVELLAEIRDLLAAQRGSTPEAGTKTI